MGSISIIDVARGTYLSTRAESLGGFTGVSLFTEPASLLPNLADVNDGAGPLRTQATAHIVDANNRMQSLTYPGPDARSRRVDAVSALFMADRVYNEFQIASSLAAASDWLFMFPTKPFYVDEFHTGFQPAIPPFRHLYDGADRYSPVKFNNRAYSQNGQSDVACSPMFGGFSCGAALHLRFVTNMFPVHRRTSNGVLPPSLVLESVLVPARWSVFVSPAHYQSPISDSGSMAFDFDPAEEPHALLPSAEGKVVRGLPVIGYWASNVVNNNVGNGVLANYAAAVRHATSVTCVKASDGTPCD